jgi:hypothetical protein
MKKKVLVVWFSQTGQLKRIADSLCAPLAADPDVELTWQRLEPATPYPFPWPFFAFFDQFPEAAHGIAPVLKPLSLSGSERYDLVILAYTVWFLSPCPPLTAFLKSDTGRAVVRDTPVITLIACRNMWLMAQEQVKALLADAGAKHCDNVVLTDSGSSLATFITTPRWMFTGRSDPVWGFPAAGIAPADVAGASRFGEALLAALRAGRIEGRTPVLAGLGAARVDDRLIASEKIGRRSFQIWGKLVRKAGAQGDPRRRVVLGIYAAFLILMIVTIVPLSMLIRALLRPLLAARLARARHYFELPSGSSAERL